MVSELMTCLYFAFGSNLLASRMHVENQDAKRAGIARLDDYRLDFYGPTGRWGGHVATIVPDTGRQVWGALWEINDISALDRQEGVSSGTYRVLMVNVTKPNKEVVLARTYELIDQPNYEHEELPSRVYLETVIQGAIESSLPDNYVKYLKGLEHNGFEGPVKIPGFHMTFRETNATNTPNNN